VLLLISRSIIVNIFHKTETTIISHCAFLSHKPNTCDKNNQFCIDSIVQYVVLQIITTYLNHTILSRRQKCRTDRSARWSWRRWAPRLWWSSGGRPSTTAAFPSWAMPSRWARAAGYGRRWVTPPVGRHNSPSPVWRRARSTSSACLPRTNRDWVDHCSPTLSCQRRLPVRDTAVFYHLSALAVRQMALVVLTVLMVRYLIELIADCIKTVWDFKSGRFKI